VNAAGWWALSRAQWLDEPPRRQWKAVEAYRSLSLEDQKKIQQRIEQGLEQPDELTRWWMRKMMEDILITTWSAR